MEKVNGIKLQNVKVNLCTCGKFFHGKEAVYCGECGKRLQKEKGVLCKLIKALIKVWIIKNARQ